MSDGRPYKQTGRVRVIARTRQIQACDLVTHIGAYFIHVFNCKYHRFISNVTDGYTSKVSLTTITVQINFY